MAGVEDDVLDGFLDKFDTQAYNSSEDAMITNNRNYFLAISDNSALRSSNQQTSENETSTNTKKSWEVELIDEVRSYPCLWDTTSRSFKETPKKAEAWRRISSTMNIDGIYYTLFVCLSKVL